MCIVESRDYLEDTHIKTCSGHHKILSWKPHICELWSLVVIENQFSLKIKRLSLNSNEWPRNEVKWKNHLIPKHRTWEQKEEGKASKWGKAQIHWNPASLCLLKNESPRYCFQLMKKWMIVCSHSVWRWPRALAFLTHLKSRSSHRASGP